MWHLLDKETKINSLNQVAATKGIPAFVVEKDYWVCMVLKAVFNSKYQSNIIFKGGTSLSKAYSIIERFSEDVDLIIDREFLGYNEVHSKTQLRKLRKTAGSFVITKFREELILQFGNLSVKPSSYELHYETKVDDMSDPNHLELVYESVIPTESYIKQRVLIEMGARALVEPSENKWIQSWVDKQYAVQEFSIESFEVVVASPVKTFLEKVMLIHEEFTKPSDRIRHERMSRHLYDLYQIYHTKYGIEAIHNHELYDKLVAFREKMNNSKWINFDHHERQSINLIPPETQLKKWKSDYKEMQENMIIGESPSFDQLIEVLQEIMIRLK